MKTYLVILVLLFVILILSFMYKLPHKVYKSYKRMMNRIYNQKFNRYNFWDRKEIENNKKKYVKNIPYNIPYNNPLFQTYHNKSKIPLDVYNNIKKYAPGYTHVIMDDKDIELFLNEYYKEDVIKTFRSLKLGAHKADLARYCILYIYGGLYMDIKVELLKPLSEIFIDKDVFYTVISKDDDHIHQGIIKSKPNNPLFLSLIDYIVKKNNPDDYIDFCKDMYTQIEKDLGTIKEGLNIGKSNIKYYLFKENCSKNLYCYDGPDQYGFCCFVFNGEDKIIKTRRSSYPWK